MEKAAQEVLQRMKSATNGPVPLGGPTYWRIIKQVRDELKVSPLELDIYVRKLIKAGT